MRLASLPAVAALLLCPGCRSGLQTAPGGGNTALSKSRLSGAGSLLRDAVDAHGGQALLNLSTLTAEWCREHALIGEDREPGPPWDKTRAWTGTALDLAGDRLAGSPPAPGGPGHPSGSGGASPVAAAG